MMSDKVKADVFLFKANQDANINERSSQVDDWAMFWSNFIKNIICSDSSFCILKISSLKVFLIIKICFSTLFAYILAVRYL